jgi:tRNA nucleotidyltransferase (CCA-adding enzyme)
MCAMVNSGELDALVAERVWQELAKGLMEERPSRLFEVLRECGALSKILPELNRLWGVPQPATHHPEIDAGVHTMMVVDYAAGLNYNLAVRFAALTHDLGKADTPAELLPRHIGHEARGVELLRALCKRLRVPSDCRDLALLVTQFHGKAHRADELRAETLLQLFYDVDAIRKPQRFEDFLRACEREARSRRGFAATPIPQAPHLRRSLQAAQEINAGEIAKEHSTPEQIRVAIHQERLMAIKNSLAD